MALITHGLTKDDNLLDVQETKDHWSTLALDKTKFKVLCLNCKLCHKPQNTDTFLLGFSPVLMHAVLVLIENLE